ncbi:MAG: hypothetical protein NC517_03255 [Firmicutes bacterium]|nr:hypothetical protein [Bacillota bacterium]
MSENVCYNNISLTVWKIRPSTRGSLKGMRLTALGCGASSAVLALGILETQESGFLCFIKVLLTLCSIMGPLLIAFWESTQETEKDRETWLHHRICVNNYIDECLEFSAGVKQYANHSPKSAINTKIPQNATKAAVNVVESENNHYDSDRHDQ